MKRLILLLWAAPLFAQAPAPPIISPAPGPFTGTQTVTITESTPGYEIHYTVDGSQPTSASQLYIVPFTISATTTVKAIAVIIPSSAVSSATYTLNVPPPPTTFPFVLTSPTTNINLSWTVGQPAPVVPTIKISDTSPCPPVPPVPLCHWPVTFTSDQPWLSATVGSTAFISTITINTTGLTAGTYKGNLIYTQSQFKTPTIKIPVTLTVTGSTPPPPVHNVGVKWNAPTGSVDGYNVYRGNASGGPYTKLGNVSSLSYSDLAVLAGTKYFYVIRSVKSSTESVNSNEASATVPTP